MAHSELSGRDMHRSFACAAGVQALAERFPGKPGYPALNTQFLGILEEQATWTEKCLGCGECMLAEFGGVCPVTRCAKHMPRGSLFRLRPSLNEPPT